MVVCAGVCYEDVDILILGPRLCCCRVAAKGDKEECSGEVVGWSKREVEYRFEVILEVWLYCRSSLRCTVGYCTAVLDWNAIRVGNGNGYCVTCRVDVDVVVDNQKKSCKAHTHNKKTAIRKECGWMDG